MNATAIGVGGSRAIFDDEDAKPRGHTLALNASLNADRNADPDWLERSAELLTFYYRYRTSVKTDLQGRFLF